MLVLARGGGGGLEPAQHVIPQVNRIRQRLEAKSVVGQAGDWQRPRDGTERDHEVRVLDCDQVFLRLDGDPPSVGVHRCRPAEQ